ncbi:MAG TPA: YegS/Rv2252/BmrU family lipid kinase [Polyangiales bacterium]|nr:YegS/Rv2252/BmrU family lipid kinase [Polyangiales bacterium]
MKATLIHSPGGGSANEQDLERAKELLSALHDLSVKLVGEGQNPGDLAREAVAEGAELLIASGGDGTVSAVASALVGNTELTLGIIPRGTANSIGGRLGVPHDLEVACKIIADGHSTVIDSAEVNGRPSLLMATIGVHAEAVIDVDPERKKSLGALAYVLEEVDRMLANDLFTVTIEADGQSLTAEANSVTVANIAPPWTLLAQGNKVEHDDGMLDVTLVAIKGFADAVLTSFHLATSALREQAAERDNIGHFRTKEVRIDAKPEKRVMIDGEDADVTPITVRCLPKSLRVLVPREP